MNKIDSLQQWEVRNSKNWEKFLSRYINFFYRCGSVKSIDIDENEQNWRIELHDENDISWLMRFKEELTLNIRSKRKEYGYSGPKELSIVGKVVKITDEECSKFIHILKKGKGNRTHAAARLGNLKCEKAVFPLIKALKDKDGTVSSRAATSLGKIGDPKAINPLIQMFQGDHGEIAMKAIVKIGKPSVEKLISNLNNNNCTF